MSAGAARMAAWQWLTLVLIVPLVAAGAWLIVRASAPDDTPPGLRIGAAGASSAYDFDYEIPPGTATRIAAGELIEIVPAELVAHVGDTIRIVNNDTANHIVGVFFVGAGEVLTQQFQSAGVLSGDCTVHPSGAFTLRVEP